MFICTQCKTNTKPGEKMTKKVTQTRKKDYYTKEGSFQGTGYETVKEAKLCSECGGKE